MLGRTRLGVGFGLTALLALQTLPGCALDADVPDLEENVGEVTQALVCPGAFPIRATGAATDRQAATNAIDGNTGTRWESAWADGQSITIDLGSHFEIAGVTLNWEAACGRDYNIDVASSPNGPWSRFAAVTGNTKAGVVTHLGRARSVRYVKVVGIRRCTQYGFSLWELGVNVASLKCYQDGDADRFGVPGGFTETCSSQCPAGRAPTAGDCYDSNPSASPNQTSWFSTQRGDGSFDYDCSGVTEAQTAGGATVVCTNAAGVKQSNCASCVYNWVALDASDCGQTRCSIGAGNEVVTCH